MNILLIISDTLRRDHLGCYGNDWIRTPNLDKLASESFIFDRAYAGNFPTLPHRYDVMTGRFGFIEYDWSPLPHRATVISQVLGVAGYLTHFCVDTPHICQGGSFFDRGFHSWQWIRGQENDRYRTTPAKVKLPCDPKKLRSGTETMGQYLRNVAGRQTEADYFPALTFSAAARWIEENRAADWFVYADTFDPHEPFDPPQHYLDLYDPGYEGEQVMYPRYAFADYLNAREIKHLRALYAGEVTLVDTWVGHLLRRVEALGLLDQTIIIFTTDHGFLLGEHNITGKALIYDDPPRMANCQLYEEIAHIPLLMRMPGQQKSRRISGYVQPADLMPTIVEFAKAEDPGTMQGLSLLPVLTGSKQKVRDLAITTPSLAHDPNAGRPTTITRGDWSLIYFGSPGAPLVGHTTLTVDGLPRSLDAMTSLVPPPELYNLKDDLGQKRNVIKQHPQVASRLHAAHVRMLEQLGMEERYLQHRREL